MLYFTTRQKAREFASKANKKVTDLGATAAKRWAVKVI